MSVQEKWPEQSSWCGPWWCQLQRGHCLNYFICEISLEAFVEAFHKSVCHNELASVELLKVLTNPGHELGEQLIPRGTDVGVRLAFITLVL